MDELIPLRDINLKKLPQDILIPQYDRSKLTAGIIHIGLGNFHRAHQAWYLHRLFNMRLCHDWAIIGASVMETDIALQKKLKEQDYLTTLIELDPLGKSAEICGSIIDYLQIEKDNASLIKRIAEADIRIVSLTITEGGYYLHPSNGDFDINHPDILHDVQNPQSPKTAFGAIVEACRLRKENNIGPITGLSCDNLQENGDILKRTILELARLSNPELAQWIDKNCSFPNSMVDCIVPATKTEEIALVKEFGINDLSPVTHENFRQWVIEDNFCAGRPEWEKVGVIFSQNVHDFELMKLRILNGGHQIISIPGELLGLNTIAETMAHPLIQKFLNLTVKTEIIPHVKAVPNVRPLDYLELIEKRFNNPEIKDTTRRVAYDGSARQTNFLLPSIRDGLKNGSPISGLVLANVLWFKYCCGIRENGTTISSNAPDWQERHEVALKAKSNSKIWLAQHQIYGDLGTNTIFCKLFSIWAEEINQKGVEYAIQKYISETTSE